MPKRSQKNITLSAAEAAPPGGVLWDKEVPGFGLRVTKGGSRTWIIKYRTADGGQRWHRIASFPSTTAEEARKKARALRASVDNGDDPSAQREANKRAAVKARAAAVDKLADEYAEVLPTRPSVRKSGRISAVHAANEVANVRAAIDRLDLEGVPVAKVEPSHLLRLLSLEAERPATARARFGAFSRFLEWCRDTGHLTINPAAAVPKARRPKPPPPRQRVVSLPELARLWIAAETLSPPLGELARALMVLPVRRGEAARMAWQDVDLTRGIWTLPGAITKNGDPHRLALPPLVLKPLRARHRDQGEPARGFVFASSRTAGEISGWSKIKTELATAAGFSAWTWHDFRRSFASIMAERGIAEPVADAMLNHRQSATRGGVMGVYQQSKRWPEQEAAMRAWGSALAEAIQAQQKAARRPGAKPRTPLPAGASKPESRPRRRAGAAA